MPIRGVRPATAAVVEPVDEEAMGQVVERSRSTGDREPVIRKVDVVELQRTDRAEPRRMHRRQRDEQLGLAGRGDLERPGDLVRAERLPDRPLVRTDRHATRRVREDDAVLLRPREQRPERPERVLARVALERLGIGDDVRAADLAQVVVGRRPLTERRQRGTKVRLHDARVTRPAARSSVVEGACPLLDRRRDARHEPAERIGQPDVKPRRAVVEEHPHLGKDLDRVGDARSVLAKDLGEARHADHFAPAMLGEERDKAPLERAAHLRVEATELGQTVGEVEPVGEPGVRRRRPVAEVDAGVVVATGGLEQLLLDPIDARPVDR